MTSGPSVGVALAKGATATYLALGFAATAAVAVQIVLSRALGVDAFGQYAYSLGWINFLTVAAVLGFETVVVRFSAAYRVRQEAGLLRGLLRTAFGMSVGLAAGIAALVVAAALTFVRDASLAWSLAIGAALLPALAASRIVTAALQGARRVAIGHMTQGVLRPLIIGSAVLIMGRLWNRAPAAPEAMAANVAGTMLAVGAGLAVLRVSNAWTRGAAPAVGERAAWITAVLPNTLIVASQTILLYTDVLMVGALTDTRSAGIYSVAVQLVMAISLGLAAVNTIAAPLMAESHAASDRSALQDVLALATRWMLAYGLAAGVALVLGRDLLLGFYGPAFREGGVPLMILVAGQIVIAACGPVGFLSTMTGFERQASYFVFGSAVANVALNALLIPAYGMVGAATATTVAVGLRSVLLSGWVGRHLGYRVGIGLGRTSGREQGHG